MSYHILTGTMSCDNTVKPVFSGGPWNGPLTRYVKFRVAHAPGMPGTFSPPPRVSDPDMHHGTCVTHVPWCMLGSLTSGFLWSRWWASVPGIPSACATRNFTYLVRGPWKHRQYPNFCIFPLGGPLIRTHMDNRVLSMLKPQWTFNTIGWAPQIALAWKTYS